LFTNLYFLRDPILRDHNFSDFWDDPGGGGGDPIEQVSADEIERYIRDSYRPNSVKPEMAEGFPPDFYPILRRTFSRPCCESFIRAHPALPITPRDYFLSKAFQFVYSAVVIRYNPDAEILTDRIAVPTSSEIAAALAATLDSFTDENLMTLFDPEFSWWWDLYGDTMRFDLETVLKHFAIRLKGMGSHEGSTQDYPTEEEFFQDIEPAASTLFTQSHPEHAVAAEKAERRRLLEEFKTKCKLAGRKITNADIGLAVKPDSKDPRTIVDKWRACDRRYELYNAQFRRMFREKLALIKGA
jgi:hypothetical protein